MLILDYLVDPKGSHTKLMRRAQAVLRSKPGGKDTEMRERWCNNRGRDWNDGTTSQRMKRHEQARSRNFWREHSPAYTDFRPTTSRAQTRNPCCFKLPSLWYLATETTENAQTILDQDSSQASSWPLMQKASQNQSNPAQISKPAQTHEHE